jgi:hypothetical protein
MKKQFTFEEFVDPIVNLQPKECMRYPANAYQTVYTVKKVISDSLSRRFKDHAISKTYRILIRET